MSGERGGESSVQLLCRRLYRRRGSRGIIRIGMVLPVISGTCWTLVMAVWLTEFLNLSSDDFLVVVAISTAPLVLGVGLVELVTREQIRAVGDWDRTERTPGAATAAWHATVTVAYVTIKRGIAINIFIIPPLLSGVIVAALGLPALVVIPVWCTFAVSRMLNAVFALSAIDLLLRPLLEDIARFLPDDFTPTLSGWQLRSKALAPLPTISLFSALCAGAFADIATDGPWRLGATLAIGLGTITLLGPVFVVITRSSLDPLDNLRAATARIRAGDYTTTVPVITADELGELASSFNLMVEAVRAAQARVVAAADAERRRVERDLHDGAQQRLVLLKLKLNLARRRAAGDPELAALHDELLQGIETASKELRDLAHGIYPALLESEGLCAALRDAAQRAAIPTSLECRGDRAFPAHIESAVYFCCLEALQNAAKYAGDGARAHIRLDLGDGDLRFCVSDDGAGFDRDRTPGVGLRNMADRMGALGGTLSVDSAPGEGTRVVGVLVARHVAARAEPARELVAT